MTVIAFQKVESTLVFGASLVVYNELSASWLLFFGLLLIPDIFMIGYFKSKHIGAKVYNVGHSYSMPAILVATGLALDHALWLQIATIWVAHISMDRALGYGLKHSKGFHHTHLGVIGKGKF